MRQGEIERERLGERDHLVEIFELEFDENYLKKRDVLNQVEINKLKNTSRHESEIFKKILRLKMEIMESKSVCCVGAESVCIQFLYCVMG